MKGKVARYFSLFTILASVFTAPLSIFAEETKTTEESNPVTESTTTKGRDITGNSNVSSSFKIDSQANNTNLSVTPDLEDNVLYGNHTLVDLFQNYKGDKLVYRIEGAKFDASFKTALTMKSGEVIGSVTGKDDKYEVVFNDSIESYNTLDAKYMISLKNLIPTEKGQKGAIKIYEEQSNKLVYTINIIRDKEPVPPHEENPATGFGFYGFDATAWPGGSWNGGQSFELGGGVNGKSWNPISGGKMRITFETDQDEDGNPYPIRFFDYRDPNSNSLGAWSIWTRIPAKENPDEAKKEDYIFQKGTLESRRTYFRI